MGVHPMSEYTKSEVMNYIHEYERLVDDEIDRLQLVAQCGAINLPNRVDVDSYLDGMVEGLRLLRRGIDPLYQVVTERIPS